MSCAILGIPVKVFSTIKHMILHNNNNQQQNTCICLHLPHYSKFRFRLSSIMNIASVKMVPYLSLFESEAAKWIATAPPSDLPNTMILCLSMSLRSFRYCSPAWASPYRPAPLTTLQSSSHATINFIAHSLTKLDTFLVTANLCELV